jgi:hypothetical protein
VGRDYDAFDLICRFRCSAAHAQGARRKREEAQRLRQIRGQVPRRPRCLAPEIRR